MRKKIIAKIILVFLLLAILVEAYGIYKHNFLVEIIAELLLIPLITLFYLSSVEKVNKWYLIALSFSFLGDIFLLGINSFLAGVSCYFVVHLIFIKITLDFMRKISITKLILPLFFLLAFLVLIVWVVKEGVDGFIFFILCYGVALCFFTALSFLNNTEKPSKENTLLFFGAFVFVITNSLSGVNRFYISNDSIKIISIFGYVLAQYLVCLSIIKKTVITYVFDKKVIFSSLFFLTIVIGLLVITEKKFEGVFVITPLIFIFLILIYINSVRKSNLVFLSYLFLVLMVEAVFLFRQEYLFTGTLCSILSQILLIYFLINFKNVRIKNVLVYFLILLVAYLMIYFYVVKVEKHFIYVVFIIVNSLLTALALDNYLYKMNLPNYLLWLGVSFGVFDNILVALDVYSVHLTIYPFIINIISDYLICRSFIIRQNRLDSITQ